MNAQTTTVNEIPQYARALERANTIRLARAEIKRQVLIGKTQVADVILACPEAVETMEIGDLLICQRRWGRTRMRKFVTELALKENKAIGTLTDRQRNVIAGELRALAPASAAVTRLPVAPATRPSAGDRPYVIAA